MTNLIITEQPVFFSAKTHSGFLKINKINSCLDIKDIYHQCMRKRKKFSICEYYYNMMFICQTLKYEEEE